MRRTSAIVPILLVGILSRVGGAETASSSQPTLGFYVVRDKIVKGGAGRFIDTKDFPKLGYIRQTPDLVITGLVAVARGESGRILVDKGQATSLSETHSNVVVITLQPQDARKFEDLTKQNIGNRILLLLGETPLTAPIIMGPISSPTIQITVPNEQEVQRIEQELRKFVEKP